MFSVLHRLTEIFNAPAFAFMLQFFLSRQIPIVPKSAFDEMLKILPAL